MKFSVLVAMLSVLTVTGAGVQAAPIQGVLNPGTGAVVVSGFTGEVFFALRGPEELLLPANALPSTGLTLDATLPGEIAYLGLSGIQGSVNIGNVVKAGLPIADLLQLKIAYQVGFTSGIVELPARLPLSNDGTIPAGEPGLFLPFLPEPTSSTLLIASAGAVMAASRRRRSYQRFLLVQ